MLIVDEGLIYIVGAEEVGWQLRRMVDCRQLQKLLRDHLSVFKGKLYAFLEVQEPKIVDVLKHSVVQQHGKQLWRQTLVQNHADYGRSEFSLF